MVMQRTTRTLLTAWAARSNVSPEKLMLDAQPDSITSAVEFVVEYDGSVDERFFMDELYAVNVADELVVQCQQEANFDEMQRPAEMGSVTWSITVTRYRDQERILHYTHLDPEGKNSDQPVDD